MNSQKKQNSQRAYWLKTLHQWHWISSALCLLGMLLFSITGFTLNHASQIETQVQMSKQSAMLPEHLVKLARTQAKSMQPSTADNSGNSSERITPLLPQAIQDWALHEFDIRTALYDAEWSVEELFVSMPRPGGDAWLRINLDDGLVEYERTDRGWISYFNDLHKGRHTGAAWGWFIDLFALACLIFTLTGLFILKMHASNRPLTWPLTAMGLVIPLLLALLLIH